jgi:hypothetical protein
MGRRIRDQKEDVEMLARHFGVGHETAYHVCAMRDYARLARYLKYEPRHRRRGVLVRKLKRHANALRYLKSIKGASR